MNYEEFKTTLAEHGIMPFTRVLETSIESLARSNPDALKHYTGCSSPEEVYANLSRDKLVSLLQSWFEDYGSHYEVTIEDLTGFDSVEKFLDYDPRATDDDIRRVEEALGVSLPTDFVRFHKEFGANRWTGFKVYGKQGEYKVGFAKREWDASIL